MGRNKITPEQQQKSQERFIKKAKIVHNDKYDYSLVVYKHSHEKVKIKCPVHGVFEQSPNYHTNIGIGCVKCVCPNREKNREKNEWKEVKKQFIEHFSLEEVSLMVKLREENKSVDEIIEIFNSKK